MPDENETIQQQAEQIESLQNELVQAYDELYHKEKRKQKREDCHGSPRWERGFFLYFLWWFLIMPGRLRDYSQHLPRAVEIRDCWKLTGFLAFFPMLVGIIGFVFGATHTPLAVPVRLGIGLLLVAGLAFGWTAIAELKYVHDSRRAVLAVSVIAFIFSMAVGLSVLDAAPNPALIFVALAGIANGGLVQGISSVATDRPHRRSVGGRFAVSVHVAYTIILLGAILSTIVQRSHSTTRPGDFILSAMVLGPVFFPMAFSGVWVISMLFSFEMIWSLEQYREEGFYLSSAILRLIYQLLIMAVLLVLYGGLIVFSLLGIRASG